MEVSSEKHEYTLDERMKALEERLKVLTLRLDSEHYKRYKLKKKVSTLSSKLESLGEKVSEVEGYLYDDEDEDPEDSSEEE